MSKYNNFETFVTSVIEESDNKCRVRYNCSLTEAYQTPLDVFKMILAIVPIGWPIFLNVIALLALGPVAFALSLTFFTISPVGVLVIAALAVFGGIKAIKLMYQYSILPTAIKDMGEKYKSSFQAHINEKPFIDNLINEASEYLIIKATKPLIYTHP